MGYNTYFQLDTIPENAKEEVARFIENYDGYDFSDIKYACGDDLYGGDTCKWYDHVRDMKELSLRLPGITFKLKGEGEEPGDLWYQYFRDGKTQLCKAKITFDEYDENKLK